MMTLYDSREKLSELVPHKGKMLLLDRIVFVDLPQLQIETEVDVRKQSLFYEESLKGVPCWIGFEYMAQSISCLSGILARQENLPAKMGFILSVNDFRAKENVFPEGCTVHVRAKQSLRMETTMTFDGSIFIEGVQMATATIYAVESDNPKETLGV